MSWKERAKEAYGIFKEGMDLLDLFKDFQIVKIARSLTADHVSVTRNKRFHKRQFGDAFTKLNRKERDAIRDIMVVLRRKKELENFILNVSLYGGEPIEPSIELLKTLAQFGTAEAVQLIEDMELAKEPVHRGQALEKKILRELKAAKRDWDQAMTQASRFAPTCFSSMMIARSAAAVPSTSAASRNGYDIGAR